MSFVANYWVNGAIRSRNKRESDTGHPDFGSYKLTALKRLPYFTIETLAFIFYYRPILT